MNGQNFGEEFNRSNSFERTGFGSSDPVVNPEGFTDRFASNEDPIQTPVAENVADVNPLEEPVVDAVKVIDVVQYDIPADPAVTVPVPAVTTAGSQMALFDHGESEQLRTRWNDIQGKFVDEPRVAVQQADELVSDVIAKIDQMFANEHSTLEGQWKQGNEVSTEELRKALKQYRSFFNRLVV